MKYSTEQIESSRERLTSLLKVGQVIYTNLKHRARSGMMRHISLHVVEDGQIVDITWAAARVMGYRISDKTGGIVVGGCGMDMGFHLVYSLGRRMFPNGVNCTGCSDGKATFRCNSNDHVNGSRLYNNGIIHSDGGYAFDHRWI